MLLNSREFKFLKNYKNVYVKSACVLIGAQSVSTTRSRALGSLILASEASCAQ